MRLSVTLTVEIVHSAVTGSRECVDSQIAVKLLL